MSIIYSEMGFIDSEGKLHVYNRELMHQRVSQYAKTNVVVTIEKYEKSISHQQRKYYFSIVLRELQNAYWTFGIDKSKEELDHQMRMMFLYREEYNPESDTWTREPRRLSDNESTVSFAEFTVFLEKIIWYAAAHLEWSIPYPNEVMTAREYTDRQIESAFKSNRK